MPLFDQRPLIALWSSVSQARISSGTAALRTRGWFTAAWLSCQKIQG